MLSKKQAKVFFLLGTGLCCLAFLGLTLDSLRQIPIQTHAENMTESVTRGKHLWEDNNCMGCHTLLGEGAYYAPELTKVYTRRGSAFIKAMIADPEAMYPGERRMQKYNFTNAQIDDLVNFFKWIGEIDLNGYPAKPDLMNVAIPASSQNERPIAQASNRPLVFNQMCIACHELEGQGGKVGPALDEVGDRKTRQELELWLRNPLEVKQDSKMPKLPLTESDITELAAFLSTKKNGAGK